MSDSEDSLALIDAIRYNSSLDEICELIRSGIDVNTQIEDESCEYGSTALMWATLYGHGDGRIARARQ